MRVSIWPAIHPRILELIRSHRSTLVFVNSRRLAERLAQRLNELAGEDLVRAHHGSIAREQRVAIEEALKEGRLPALVATSSLELGIDMGAIDLVIQVESPTSVARGLQRIGRAGHQVDEVSSGVIFPKYRGDLLECAVVAERMREGAIEATAIPRTPLDVLAQQIVAMTVMDRWSVADLHAVVARAMPFETITREALEGVLAMLAGAYPSDEFAELKPRLAWDRVADTVEGRRDARVVAVTSGGTIPDRGLYGVFVAGEAGTPGPAGGRAGRGDGLRAAGRDARRRHRPGRQQLAGRRDHAGPRHRGARARGSRASSRSGRATPSAGRSSWAARSAPSCARSRATWPAGRRAGRRALARLRRAPSPRPAGGREPRRLPGGRARGRGRPADRPPDRRGAVPRRAGRLAARPPHAVRRPRPRPVGDGDRGPPARAPGRRGVQHLVGRRDRDPPAGRRPRGRRGRPLPRCRRGGGPGRRGRRRDGALRRPLPRERGAGPAPAAPPARARGPRSGSSASARPTCSRSPAATAASRSSSRPTASAWPTSSTCRPCATCCAAWSGARSPSTAWRRRGPRRSPRRSSSTTSPPTCTRATPRSPSGGRRRWRSTATSSASCSARRSCASCWTRRRSRRRSSSARRSSTSARPGPSDQVADLLRRLGDLIRRRGRRADPGRTRRPPASGWRRWPPPGGRSSSGSAARRAGSPWRTPARYRDATGAQPPPGTPGRVPRRDARRPGRPPGPLGADARPVPAPPSRPAAGGSRSGSSRRRSTRLVEAGSLLRGEFRPGGSEREWCDPDVLRLLRRRSLARLRREVEPVEPAALARFLPAWQGVAAAPVAGRSGPTSRRRCAARRRWSGSPRSSTSWPASRSRPRCWSATCSRPGCPGYQPRLLDELGALGEVAWVGLRAAGPRRRADRALPAGPGRRPAGGARRRRRRRPASGRTGRATRRSGHWLARRGASFYRELFGGRRRRLGPRGPRRAVGPGLGRRGHERHLRPAAGAALEAPRRATGGRGPGRLATLGPPEAAGRWSLVEAAAPRRRGGAPRGHRSALPRGHGAALAASTATASSPARP